MELQDIILTVLLIESVVAVGIFCLWVGLIE